MNRRLLVIRAIAVGLLLLTWLNSQCPSRWHGLGAAGTRLTDRGSLCSQRQRPGGARTQLASHQATSRTVAVPQQPPSAYAVLTPRIR